MHLKSKKKKTEGMRQKVEFFDRLLSIATDGIVITDSFQSIIAVNNVFAAIFNQSHDDIIESNLTLWLEQLDSNALVTWLQLQKHVYKKGSCRDVKFNKTSTNGLQAFHVNAQLVEQAQTKKNGLIISVWRNITQQCPADTILDGNRHELELEANAIRIKQLQDINFRLQESEQQLRSVTNSAIDGIISADSDGIITLWNRGAEFIFGYSHNEVIGKQITLLMPRRYQEFHRKAIERIRTTGETRNTGKVFELIGLRKTGVEFPLEISLDSWIVNKKRFLSAVVRDISERKRIESKIQRDLKFRIAINILLHSGLTENTLVNQLEIALELILSGSWLAAGNKGAILLNNEKTDSLELVVHKAMPKQVINSCKDVPKGYCLCGLAAASRQVVFASDIDERHSRHYSGMQPHGHYCVPIMYQNQVLGVITVYLASGHKRSQEEEAFLLAMSNTLAGIIIRKRMEEALLQAKDDAERANQSKSAFLATMSHEIRTPMNAILGMTELLMASNLDDRQKHFADTVYNSGNALLTIINDILDFSKIEAEKLELKFVPFNIRHVIKDVLESLLPRIYDKKLAYSIEMAKGTKDVYIGDPVRFRQILINFFGNAIKFTQHGRIEIYIDIIKEIKDMVWLRCTIDDTGIGIAADKKLKLFKPFSQADNSTTRRYGGTGLGLRIAKELAQLMHGEVGFQSIEGEGSSFYFTVRLEKTAKEIACDEVDTIAQVLTTPLKTSSALVLVVEDDLVNQAVVSAMFEAFNIGVEFACDGKEALAMVKMLTYDVIFMDINMPIMDGYEATKKIRRYERNTGKKSIPIIALTAHAIDGEYARCIEAGMDDFLSKPASGRLIKEKLNRWLAD